MTSPGMTSPATSGPPAMPMTGPLAGKAPPRPAPRALALSTATAVTALCTLAGIGLALDRVVLIPPLAASMALVAGGTALPLAQPRNVVGGQLASALTGYAVLLALGKGLWPSAIAGGLALGVMLVLRTSHSPAAATAVIVAATAPPAVTFLPLLALATIVLVLVGLAGAKIERKKYPVYWW